LEKLHLNEELLKMLRAKIGSNAQITDEGIIQFIDSEDENGSPPQGFSDLFAKFNRKINELINKKPVEGSSSSYGGIESSSNIIKETDPQVIF